MNSVQVNLLKILKDYIDICEANHLQYWICGGTLLGAVRYKGFIPWDDDIDVQMPLDDYKRFLSLKEEIPGPYLLQNRENDPEFPFLFTKMCNPDIKIDSNHVKAPLGIHIDIFPLIPSKGLSFLTRSAFNLVRICEYVIRTKTGWRKYVPNGRTARIIYHLLSILPVNALLWMQRKAICLISDPSGPMLCSIGGTYRAWQEFFPKEWYTESAKMQFEELSCNTNQNWDECLKRYYGDYMTPPPADKQVSHHIDKAE